jgi:hypothetical protein
MSQPADPPSAGNGSYQETVLIESNGIPGGRTEKGTFMNGMDFSCKQ